MGYPNTGNDRFSEKKFKNILLKIPQIVLIILYCIPVIFGLFYISGFAVNVPQADPWNDLIPMTNALYGGTFDFADLIKTQNDSRPVVSNLVTLSVSWMTHLNMKTLYYVGYFIYICCIILIFYLIKREINFDFKTLILLFPLLCYMLNPFFLARFLNNIGSVYYPVMLLTALIAIFSLNKSKDSNWFFLLSVVMAVACSFSYAAGFAVWIAGFVQLLVQTMVKKSEKIFLWCSAAFLTFLTNYVILGFPSEGPHSMGAITVFLDTAVRYPFQKFLCFMGSLGAEIIFDSQTAMFFGLLIFFGMVGLLIINRQSLELDRYSCWYGLLVFGLLTSFMVTVSRSASSVNGGSPDTIFFIPAVRHSLAIFLPLVCLYVLALMYTKNSYNNNLSTSRNRSDLVSNPLQKKYLNSILLVMIFCLVLAGFLFHISSGIKIGEMNYSRMAENKQILLNYANEPDEKIQRLQPNHPDRVRPEALLLEKNNLSVFYQPGQ
jgi:hypothetical protein